MTETEAAYAIAGGMVGTVLGLGILFYILVIIAFWRIFTKAGEAGWKSIIPIYNVYILYKISWSTKAFWVTLLIAIVLGLIQGIFGAGTKGYEVMSVITAIYTIIIDIVTSNKLAKAFGHNVGYTIGLLILPNIFTLILGFGHSEYTKPEIAE